MNQELIDQIARAVLYEGYILYPYRPSVKNRQRWSFGGLYPPSWSEAQDGTDPATMQTQCLVFAPPGAQIEVNVRFLHLTARAVGRLDAPPITWPPENELAFQPVESLQ